MRELKFRAYHKYMQKMLVPVKIHLENGKVTCFETLLDDNVYQVKIDDKEYGLHIMQYTGLKDKNGKEIYEGDIIIDYNKQHSGYNIPLEVIITPYKTTTKEEPLGYWAWKWYEVIGNIYENTELLK